MQSFTEEEDQSSDKNVGNYFGGLLRCFYSTASSLNNSSESSSAKRGGLHPHSTTSFRPRRHTNSTSNCSRIGAKSPAMASNFANARNGCKQNDLELIERCASINSGRSGRSSCKSSMSSTHDEVCFLTRVKNILTVKYQFYSLINRWRY